MMKQAPVDENWVSGSCQGEKCTVCGKPATKKIAEVIMPDDPNKIRHELVGYVCTHHFDMVIRPYKYKKDIETPSSLEGCPFMYCDSNPQCTGKCRYVKE